MGNLNEKEIYTDLKLVEGTDIKDISGKTITIKKVNTAAELPSQGEGDTDLYLVADEDTFYEWDLPSLSWVVPASNSKGFTNGCRLSYVNATTIRVNSGVIGIKNKNFERTSPLDLNWTNVEAGVTRQAGTWYFVYASPDPTNKARFTAFISRTAPSEDQFGNTIASDAPQAKYHPTLVARFVGSFRTDASQNIVNFRLIGNYVAYVGQGTNLFLTSGNARNKTAVNCRSLVPITSSLCNVYYALGSGSNTRYVGDSAAWYIVAIAGSAVVTLPVTNDSIYYQCTGTNTVSLGVHGYYEDI